MSGESGESLRKVVTTAASRPEGWQEREDQSLRLEILRIVGPELLSTRSTAVSRLSEIYAWVKGDSKQ